MLFLYRQKNRQGQNLCECIEQVLNLLLYYVCSAWSNKKLKIAWERWKNIYKANFLRDMRSYWSQSNLYFLPVILLLVLNRFAYLTCKIDSQFEFNVISLSMNGYYNLVFQSITIYENLRSTTKWIHKCAHFTTLMVLV